LNKLYDHVQNILLLFIDLRNNVLNKIYNKNNNEILLLINKFQTYSIILSAMNDTNLILVNYFLNHHIK